MTEIIKRINVAYVIGQLNLGGTESQLLELVSNINLDKFKIHVLCLSGEATLAPLFITAGCEVSILNREKCGRLIIFYKIFHLLMAFKPDIVHSFDYASRAAIPISKIILKCKSIVSIRTQPGWQVNWLDRFLYSFADYILTNSQTAQESILASFSKRVPSQVIYNGIDLQKFDNNSRLDLPTALAHNFQGKVIGIVARLHPIKGLDVLLDAFTIISEEFDNVQLWIVGDGPDQEKLKHRAAQLGIISKVIFWGKCDNIPSILKFVDVGVMSSHVEGLPNAIIEYMSARLPVVSTNVGGIPELVVHNNTGLLVDPADPTKLAQAVLVLLKSPGLSRSLGENGRKLIEKSFDLGRMVIETETIYETLCPRK